MGEGGALKKKNKFDHKEHSPAKKKKFIHKKQKIVLHIVILELVYSDPQLHQILKLIIKFLCSFLLI